ncbi:hypothetical protein [Nocardioides bruguierae]|uniref:hypothetical protein n=1 Tax=Nocardioides bruguierae TaxID=2945102 RepID=UPI0020214EF6|nr:hypothetical protein [Nocardioides bruguierae]MCL8026015.1 hypothetical protein [Nocardioides bruguierae]
MALPLAMTSCSTNNSDSAASEQPTASEAQQGSSDPAAVDRSALTDQARRFVAFARSGDSEVTWADEVTYRLSGDEVAVLSSTEADDPESWEGCVEGQKTFQERRCPVSLLSVVEASFASGGPVVSTRVPATVGCTRVSARSSWSVKDVAAVRAPESMSNCVDDFLVVLEFSATATVDGIDLEMTSP